MRHINTRIDQAAGQWQYESHNAIKIVCEKFCKKHGYDIIESFGGTYESAKNDEHKEFNPMLALIKKNKIKISQIVLYSIDRFNRSGANAIYNKEQF